MTTDGTSPSDLRKQLEAVIRGYMDACTAGDAPAIASYLSEDAVHFFPPDMYGGPWRGATLISSNWAKFVAERQSAWTVDSIVLDVDNRAAASEWTHIKGTSGIILRGTEIYEFDQDNKIREIRAYYASPQANDLDRLELGGFDYEARGYGAHR